MPADAQARDAFANVLALKTIPALAQAHPDDLIGLARRAVERRVPAGAPLAASAVDGERSLFFVLEGGVRELREGRELGRAAGPALPGLLSLLADDERSRLIADTDVVALEIARPVLLELLEDEFELWLAALRHACHCALAEGALRIGWPAGRAPLAAPAAPADLAARIQLLRAVAPFARLPVALLGQLAIDMEPLAAGSGSVLQEPGAPAAQLLLIAGGELEAEGAGPGGARRFAAGALLGLLETLAAAEPGARLRARGPVQALRLDGEALVDALEDDAASAVELLCALARHARGGS